MKVVKPGDGQHETNPKLEMAAKEIADILKKYDIAGVVQMFTPGFNKYTMNIAPSFSVVSVNAVGQLKITPPLVDPENPDAAKQRIVSTVQMLANMRMYLGKLVMTITQSEMVVRQQFGMMPKPGGPNNLPIKN